MSQQDPQQYDATLKSLIGDEVAEILPNLLPEAEYISEQNIEINRTTLKADLVYNINYRGLPQILNMELQTDADEDMPKRLLKYHVGLYDKHNKPVISLVIYPFETSIPEPPFREMSGDEALLTLNYRVLCLWKLDAQQFVRDRVICMYTLLPAMKGVNVPLLVQALQEMRQHYTKQQFGHHLVRFKRIIRKSKTLSEQEKQIMNGELRQYDWFLDENPEIQERVARGEAKGAQKVVTGIIEARFPNLVALAQQRLALINNLDTLSLLARQVATVSDEATARWLLDSLIA